MTEVKEEKLKAVKAVKVKAVKLEAKVKEPKKKRKMKKRKAKDDEKQPHSHSLNSLPFFLNLLVLCIQAWSVSSMIDSWSAGDVEKVDKLSMSLDDLIELETYFWCDHDFKSRVSKTSVVY